MDGCWLWAMSTNDEYVLAAPAHGVTVLRNSEEMGMKATTPRPPKRSTQGGNIARENTPNLKSI